VSSVRAAGDSGEIWAAIFLARAVRSAGVMDAAGANEAGEGQTWRDFAAMTIVISHRSVIVLAEAERRRDPVGYPLFDEKEEWMPQAPEDMAKDITIAFLQSTKLQVGVQDPKNRVQMIADQTGAAIGELYLAILAKLKGSS
jgi:hypothetical protein